MTPFAEARDAITGCWDSRLALLLLTWCDTPLPGDRSDFVRALYTRRLMGDPDMEWYVKGMSKEQLEKIRKYYEERYGKGEAATK